MTRNYFVKKGKNEKRRREAVGRRTIEETTTDGQTERLTGLYAKEGTKRKKDYTTGNSNGNVHGKNKIMEEVDVLREGKTNNK
jgi:hypothetical protein